MHGYFRDATLDQQSTVREVEDTLVLVSPAILSLSPEALQRIDIQAPFPESVGML